ncbi:MAG: Ig-like domain-containing protein, partial [Aureliella sp.]
MVLRNPSVFSPKAISNSFHRMWSKRESGRKRKSIRQHYQTIARRQLVEQLEPRHMMALSILSVSPLDNAIEVPVDTNLVINFNESVLKGQGNIYVVRDSTGTEGVAVDVNSANVIVAGSQVTIDLPNDLALDNGYSVRIDNGAFIDSSTGQTAGTTLFTQDFEYEALGPFVTPSELGGDGTDFTLTPPLGMSVDNSNLGANGILEWSGWSFADKNSWAAEGGQDRNLFTQATGTVAVADPDEWDDSNIRTGLFNSLLTTRPINLSDVTAGSVALEFDSSFRAEGAQLGKVSVSYDGGAFTDLQTFLTNDALNSHIVLDSSSVLNSVVGGGTIESVLNSPASGTVQFRFSMLNAGNNWWWAIDNVKVTGDHKGVPFAGISNATDWNFSTPAALALSMSIAPGTINENGGTAVGTVTRNKQFDADLVVTLSSGDLSEATVPASVTILAGQASATFPITAVDDALSDRTQTVQISATSATYGNASATMLVADDEGPKIISLVPADDAEGVDYRSDLLVTFDAPVKKGNGLIRIVRGSDNFVVSTIDVTSAAVSVSGAVVTINPPLNLAAPDGYYVLMDDGTFLDTSSTVTPNTVLLTQDFELLPLAPFANGETGGDGTDVTHTPPGRFSLDNSGMIGGASSNWNGWTFADKNAWTKGDSARGQFTNGTGTVAVGDPIRWSATAGASKFNSFLTTASIDLAGIAANSVSIEFDSSYSGGLPQKGQLMVSYNGGSTWTEVLVFDNNNALNAHIALSNANAVNSVIGGGTVRNKLSNPTSGNMQFRFTVINSLDSGWWAIDNIRIAGQTEGVPFQGISSPATWNFAVERP